MFRSIIKPITILAITLAGLAASSSSFAKEGDIEACEGLEDGDACTRADGDAGICQPDASDPGVITCDDDGLGAGNSGNSGAGNSGNSGSSDNTAGSGGDDDGPSVDCSASGGAGAPGSLGVAFGLALLGAAFVGRRR